jgi:hypothetical protein
MQREEQVEQVGKLQQPGEGPIKSYVAQGVEAPMINSP